MRCEVGWSCAFVLNVDRCAKRGGCGVRAQENIDAGLEFDLEKRGTL